MKRKKSDQAVKEALVMVFQFSINMIVPIVLCVILGVWIGDRTGAKWVTIPLFFAGALAGGTNVYKTVRKTIKDAKKDTEGSLTMQIAEIERKRREKGESSGEP